MSSHALSGNSYDINYVDIITQLSLSVFTEETPIRIGNPK